MTRSKLILVLIIAITVGAFFAFGGHNLLTLDNLREHQSSLAQWIEGNFLSALAGYAAVYVVVTALSLPGAAIMTLAGGALFGNLYGLLAVSLASTIGASLAFLAARFLLRDSLRKCCVFL